MSKSTMPIKGHLRELQWRLMIVAAAFIVGACLAYSYQDPLVNLLLAPLHGEKLVYLTPGGGFSFVFMITVYAGVALAFPVFLQQLYAFLKPVLPLQARRKSIVIALSSFVLLASGIIFGYLIAVPNALTFLYSFADKYVDASLTAESYLSFVTIYTIGIGIAFQVPLLLLLINLVKPLKPGGMFKSERWVILGAFIVAAIITPTVDPVNQVIIAGPLILVYQLGIIAVLFSNAHKNTHARQLKRTSREQVPVLSTPADATIQRRPAPYASGAIDSRPSMPPAPAQRHVIPHNSAEMAAPKHTRSLDGMCVINRPQPNARVATHPQRTPQRPAMPVRRVQPIPGRSFGVDGIIPAQQQTI